MHKTEGPVQEPNIIKWWKLRWLLFVKRDSEETHIAPLLIFLFFFPVGCAEQKEELADVPCKSTEVNGNCDSIILPLHDHQGCARAGRDEAGAGS